MKTPLLVEAGEWSVSSGCPRGMELHHVPESSMGAGVLGEGLTSTAFAVLTLAGCFLLAGRVLLAKALLESPGLGQFTEAGS